MRKVDQLVRLEALLPIEFLLVVLHVQHDVRTLVARSS